MSDFGHDNVWYRMSWDTIVSLNIPIHGFSVMKQGKLLEGIAKLYPDNALAILNNLATKAHDDAKRARGVQRSAEVRSKAKLDRDRRVWSALDTGISRKVIAAKENITSSQVGKIAAKRRR